MEEAGEERLLLICISSAATYRARRDSLRKSWLQYMTAPDSPLDARRRAAVDVRFAVSAPAASTSADAATATDPASSLAEEQAAHGDLELLDEREGYEHLWRKVVAFLERAHAESRYAYFMHADDDSFVRLDLLLPMLETAPRARHYWGYIWDGSTPARTTTPIRDAANKSRMPVEQWPHATYPPFASGCGFVLSWDLVAALLAQAPLPDYRLLDPPFGIHLAGGPRCALSPPVAPVHDARVRPYRALPIFHRNTLVQHYLRPEEMRPFYAAARADADARRAAAEAAPVPAGEAGTSAAPTQPSRADDEKDEEEGAAGALYAQLVALGLLRR